MDELLLGPLVGGLSHKAANLWGRGRGPGTLNAWLGSLPDLSDARLVGRSLPLSPEDGYAGVAPVSGLSPNTSYYYALTLSSQPPARESWPYPSFTTMPLPGEPRSFSFAFGSCFRPASPESGTIFNQVQARRVQDGLRFILLTGDQIYADEYEHNGLGTVACTLEEYRRVYEYSWSYRPLRAMLANLPAFMTLDDHEVDDDWTWTDLDRTHAQIPIWDRIIRWLNGRAPVEWRIPVERVRDALQAYWEHQGMHAPPYELPPNLNLEGQYSLRPEDPGSLAYTFTCGAAAFFVLDTRTMRVKGRGVRTMLGEGQWAALERWLLAVNELFPVKFLVTSASLLYPMWIDIARDRWSGFPEEQNRLLHFLAANGIEGVHLLSGDLHSSHAVAAELYGPRGRPLPLWEFCASPFEQKPNSLSRRTYTPIRNGPLRRQEVRFHAGQNCYGLVRVNFTAENRAEVVFELYGEDGGLIERVSTGEQPD